MANEINTGFIPIIECPNQRFILAKDSNDSIYVFSVNKHISGPYAMAISGVLFGFSLQEGKMAIVSVPVPVKLMKWLKSPHVTMLIESMAQ